MVERNASLASSVALLRRKPELRRRSRRYGAVRRFAGRHRRYRTAVNLERSWRNRSQHLSRTFCRRQKTRKQSQRTSRRLAQVARLRSMGGSDATKKRTRIMTTKELQAPCGHAQNPDCRSHCLQPCWNSVIFSKQACQEGAHCEDSFDLRIVHARIATFQRRKDAIHASPYGILGGCVCSQCQKRTKAREKQEFPEYPQYSRPYVSLLRHRGGWQCLTGLCSCGEYGL